MFSLWPVGDFRIPKGMTVIFYTDMVHNDATQWDQPELYKPERFLNADGKFTDARLSQFMSFGLGRRNCIGEKLAIVEIFMVVAGIFRKCKIELKEPPVDLNPVADNFFFHISKPYKIIAKPIS